MSYNSCGRCVQIAKKMVDIFSRPFGYPDNQAKIAGGLLQVFLTLEIYCTIKIDRLPKCTFPGK